MTKIKIKKEFKIGAILGIAMSIAVIFTFLISIIGGVYLGVYMESESQTYKAQRYDKMVLELEAKDLEYETLYDDYKDLEREIKHFDACEVTFEQYESAINKHVQETINITMLMLESIHHDDSCVEYLRSEYVNNESFQIAYDSFTDSYYEMTDTIGVK